MEYVEGNKVRSNSGFIREMTRTPKENILLLEY
jgi:hypothetical protein